MKKFELIESFLENKRFSGYHPDTLAIYIGMAYNTIIYETFKKDFDNLDLYSKSFTVDVQKNEIEDSYYCDLPKSIIQLPGAGDGVRQIRTTRGTKMEFVAVPNLLQVVHEHLEVGQVPGPVPYKVMGQKVIFANKNNIHNTSEVLMWLVIPFSEYDDLDEINIPSGKDAALFELTAGFASEAEPEKEINDQSEKTR